MLGAAGGIGQPLSLLLKEHKDITHLSLYDVANAPGVAADLSHIPSKAKVTGHRGADQLAAALKGSDVVVIPAGVPRKPGMTRDDLFNTNASIVATLMDGVAAACPKAMVLIIANPVNSTVPISAEVMKKHGVYDPKRLFGVTTLDVLRANTFVGAQQGVHPNSVEVEVIGGHAGITILPLLSRVPGAPIPQDKLEALTKRIQFGGDEVVAAKDGAGSATLSMAAAGARFVVSLLRGLKGEAGVVECAYVQSTAVPGLDFFSTKVELGKGGVAKVHPVPSLTAYEKSWFDKMQPELKDSIAKGVKFAQGWAPKA